MDQRVTPLTADEALTRLRELGVVEVASVAALGRMWGWKRERTSKALIRWESAGYIERTGSPSGPMVIRWHGTQRAIVDPGRDEFPASGNTFPAGNAADPVPDGVQPTVDAPTIGTGVPDGLPAGNPAVPA